MKKYPLLFVGISVLLGCTPEEFTLYNPEKRVPEIVARGVLLDYPSDNVIVDEYANVLHFKRSGRVAVRNYGVTQSEVSFYCKIPEDALLKIYVHPQVVNSHIRDSGIVIRVRRQQYQIQNKRWKFIQSPPQNGWYYVRIYTEGRKNSIILNCDTVPVQSRASTDWIVFEGEINGEPITIRELGWNPSLNTIVW